MPMMLGGIPFLQRFDMQMGLGPKKAIASRKSSPTDTGGRFGMFNTMGGWDLDIAHKAMVPGFKP